MRYRFLLLCLPLGVFCLSGRRPVPFLLEHERNIAKVEPGTHHGTGTTIGYSFFAHAEGLALVFRKRVLPPGASIGYHLQQKDEIYYVISGQGIMRMNDSSFAVQAGDAILTRPGSSHGIAAGKDTLVLLINYLQEK